MEATYSYKLFGWVYDLEYDIVFWVEYPLKCVYTKLEVTMATTASKKSEDLCEIVKQMYSKWMTIFF